MSPIVKGRKKVIKKGVCPYISYMTVINRVCPLLLIILLVPLTLPMLFGQESSESEPLEVTITGKLQVLVDNKLEPAFNHLVVSSKVPDNGGFKNIIEANSNKEDGTYSITFSLDEPTTITIQAVYFYTYAKYKEFNITQSVTLKRKVGTHTKEKWGRTRL